MSRKARRFRHLAAALLCATLASAHAHELPGNRLTLVQRERNHLSMAFYLTYSEVLHRALAPNRTYPEFLARCANLGAGELEAELARAQAWLQTETRLALPSGQAVRITHWRWPDVARVRTLLREQAMRATAEPGGRHTHEEPLEVRAEATAPQDLSAVTIRMPGAFQNVLIVSYRPAQTWVEGGSTSPVIRF